MPRKRGGKEFGPDTATEHGAMTCPTCHGGGRISRPQLEGDRQGSFDGDALTKCPECNGIGKVHAK